MTIKEIREMTGLSQRAFAEKYNIPKRSIENWESKSENHRECPQYVAELLEKVVKNSVLLSLVEEEIPFVFEKEGILVMGEDLYGEEYEFAHDRKGMNATGFLLYDGKDWWIEYESEDGKKEYLR